jgi:hypothetical protein
MPTNDERLTERDIQPGDFVIKLVHGVPMVQTRPGDEEGDEDAGSS